MSSPSDAYLTLLQQVENALEEALHGAKYRPATASAMSWKACAAKCRPCVVPCSNATSPKNSR
ncbi:hypothetical protein JCM17843_01340 [Kordiimonadales bacterium JCM 17843]|nr:hypothetical protein JCM17843_01340 [Kordiimonadales bacterium JCM 17843]